MKKVTKYFIKKKFLLASILVHLGLVLPLFLMPPPSQTEVIELVILEEKETKMKRQIVKQLKRENKKTPKETAFLSQFSQRVKKNTQAKNKSPQVSRENTQASLSKKNHHQNYNPNSNLDQFKPILSTNQPPSPTALTKKPSSFDHLKDVDDGEQTLLSTKEFLYYTYYDRIRKKIKDSWKPKILSKIRNQLFAGRSLASYQGKSTQCIVVLNSKGQLVGVKVIKKSGTLDLDESAVEAFREAEPFPNPPLGIVRKDGKILIRWDFVIES